MMFRLVLLVLMLAWSGVAFSQDYPNIQEDFNWLRQIEEKYKKYTSDPRELQLKEYQVDGKKFQSLTAQYKEEIPRNIKLKKQFQKTVARMKKFVKILNDRIKDADNIYGNHFQQAIDYMKKAAAEKNANYLVGSMEQYKVAQRVYKDRILKLISNPQALDRFKADQKKYLDKYNKLSFDLKKKQLAATKKPKEKYQGSDKEKYREMILKDWKETYPEDKVLDVIFHMKNFRRTKTKKWNGATKDWRYRDTEVLATTVAVKTSDDIVTLYYAYINKDNLSGKLSTGVKSKGSEYVIREMLSSNY